MCGDGSWEKGMLNKDNRRSIYSLEDCLSDTFLMADLMVIV